MLCHLVRYSDTKLSVKFVAYIFGVDEQSQKMPIDHVINRSRHVTEYRTIDLHCPPPSHPSNPSCTIIFKGLEGICRSQFEVPFFFLMYRRKSQRLPDKIVPSIIQSTNVTLISNL